MAGTTGTTRLQARRFHAVSIVAGSKGCAQAQALKNVRLLSTSSPRVPVVGCDRPAECACRFHHYDDRRAGPRRSIERIGAAPPWQKAERRSRRGRRAGDFSEDE